MGQTLTELDDRKHQSRPFGGFDLAAFRQGLLAALAAHRISACWRSVFEGTGVHLDGFLAEHGLAQEVERELHKAVVTEHDFLQLGILGVVGVAERFAGDEDAEAVESVPRFIIGWLFSPSGKNRRLTMVDYLVVLWMTIDLENIFTRCLFQMRLGLIGQAKNYCTNLLILDGSENI